MNNQTNIQKNNTNPQINCNHKWDGDTYYISENDKIIRWHTYKQWASYTSQAREKLIHDYHKTIGDPIKESGVSCSVCKALFNPLKHIDFSITKNKKIKKPELIKIKLDTDYYLLPNDLILSMQILSEEEKNDFIMEIKENYSPIVIEEIL